MKSRTRLNGRSLEGFTRKDVLTEVVRERLVGLRDLHHLSDTQWAKGAKLSQQEVSRFARGRMRFPSLDFMNALANVFQLTVGQILLEEMPVHGLSLWEQKVLAEIQTMTPTEREAFDIILFRRTRRSNASSSSS